MTVELTSAHSSPFLTVLEQAAIAFQGQWRDRPAAATVVAALLQAEKTAKQEHRLYPFVSLLGDWQLCFATGTRKRRQGGIALGSGFYVPKLAVAQISFQAETEAEAVLGKGAIGNQVRAGAVRLRFTGPAQYPGKKNLLAFDFTHLQLDVLGKTVYSGTVPGRKPQQDFYSRAIGTLPFFAFFLVTPDFIAARGRGGGLALWVRESAAQIPDFSKKSGI